LLKRCDAVVCCYVVTMGDADDQRYCPFEHGSSGVWCVDVEIGV
jgi:hypothetical protein